MRRPERRWRRLDGRRGCRRRCSALPGRARPSEPLPPDKAFRFSARLVDARTVEARFIIADGYYLYRDKIHFAIEPAAAGLAVPQLPDGNGEGRPVFRTAWKPIVAMWSSSSR